MKPVVIPLVVVAALAPACSDSGAPPGLAAPSCTMTWQTYRVDAITLPESANQATQYGFDLDQHPGDNNAGIDNQLGTTHATLRGIAEQWDVNPAIAAHLAAGRVTWLLQVGQCTDGDEVRTRLGRGADADGDGVLEPAAAGIPAVGTRGERVVTAQGTARVPVGFLTDGRGDLATDAWQVGFALATDLWREPDGALAGKLGFGLGRFSDAAIEPLRAYATAAIGDSETGRFWRDFDADRDGAISVAELREVFDLLAPPDVDLGTPTEDDAGYQIANLDGVYDHVSLGIAVHATPVAIE